MWSQQGIRVATEQELNDFFGDSEAWLVLKCKLGDDLRWYYFWFQKGPTAKKCYVEMSRLYFSLIEFPCRNLIVHLETLRWILQDFGVQQLTSPFSVLSWISYWTAPWFSFEFERCVWNKTTQIGVMVVSNAFDIWEKPAGQLRFATPGTNVNVLSSDGLEDGTVQAVGPSLWGKNWSKTRTSTTEGWNTLGNSMI